MYQYDCKTLLLSRRKRYWIWLLAQIFDNVVTKLKPEIIMMYTKTCNLLIIQSIVYFLQCSLFKF